MPKPDLMKDRQFLQHQLDEERENLRLIEERIAQYVQETDVPLQLIRDEQHRRTRLAELEQALALVSQADGKQTLGRAHESAAAEKLPGVRRTFRISGWQVGVAVGVVVCLASAIILLQNKAPCDHAAVNYDFETGSNEGWDVRDEGDRRLGVNAQPDRVQHCGAGSYALAFRFAQTADRPTAQVKLETAHLRLTDQLSAWVYTPPDLPVDIQASCFVLENNATRRWSDKPEWPWYQTGNRSLKPGEWTLVECPAADFVAKQFAGTHWDDPQLLGFEFTRASGQPFEGTLYLDKIIVR